MSNPGVRYLIDTEIAGRPFRVEDNIGEAVHIHWGNWRISCTIKEFYALVDELMAVVNRIVGVEGFDAGKLNETYFFEAPELSWVSGVRTDEARLGDLRTEYVDTEGYGKLKTISESRISKAFRGDKEELLARKQYNDVGDTNESRMQHLVESIHKHGYPWNGEYIVLYGDGTYIHDGCHRASILLHEKGNISVPVLRLYFSKQYWYDETISALYEQVNQRLDEEKAKQLAEIRAYRRLMTEDIPKQLHGKRVLLRGAGKHTQELLKIWQDKVNIIGVVAQQTAESLPVPVLPDAPATYQSADVIVISSWRYRREMFQELLKKNYDAELFDIYAYADLCGLPTDREFFQILKESARKEECN